MCSDAEMILLGIKDLNINDFNHSKLNALTQEINVVHLTISGNPWGNTRDIFIKLAQQQNSR